MGKPNVPATLRIIWAIVLVGLAVSLLSDSGQMLSVVYRHSSWLGTLLVLYFLASTTIYAIAAVQRAARGPTKPPSDEQPAEVN